MFFSRRVYDLFKNMHGTEIASASFTHQFWQHRHLGPQLAAVPDHSLVTITTGSTLQSTMSPSQVSEPSIQESRLLSSFCNSLRTGITMRSSQLREKQTNENLPFTDPWVGQGEAVHQAGGAPAILPGGSPTSQCSLNTSVAGSAWENMDKT